MYLKIERLDDIFKSKMFSFQGLGFRVCYIQSEHWGSIFKSKHFSFQDLGFRFEVKSFLISGFRV